MLQTDTQVSWQDYLAIVVRRRWFFTIPCVAIIAISMLVALFLPKIYRAETIMLVQDQNVVNPLIQGLAVSTPVTERLRILREELLGWTSLSRLVTQLTLDRQTKNPVVFEKLIKRLQRDINVRMHGQDLIVISYEDRDPKLSQTLVNTITNIYMERNTESQKAESTTAISFIEKEMTVYKEKLEDSERALREFKELYVMQMPVATQLNKEIIDLEVSLAQLLVENTEAHPTVIHIRRRIEDLTRKRNEDIKQVIAAAMAKGHDPVFYQDLAKALDEPAQVPVKDPTIRAAREAYQAWVNRLDSPMNPAGTAGGSTTTVQVKNQDGQSRGALEIVGASGTAAALSLGPREDQELSRLNRDYGVQSETYRQMQQRLERAKITQRLGESDEGTKFKILEPARLPLRPVWPNMWKVFFFSLLLGIFVGAGAAFVAEYLDQSFQSAEEMETALGLPVIGSISTIVTELDIAAKRQRRKHWVSLEKNVNRLKTYVVQPVWNRVDRLLVRWGL